MAGVLRDRVVEGEGDDVTDTDTPRKRLEMQGLSRESRLSSPSCPVDLATKKPQAAVSEMYARVAREPEGNYHFHRGQAHGSHGHPPLPGVTV